MEPSGKNYSFNGTSFNASNGSLMMSSWFDDDDPTQAFFNTTSTTTTTTERVPPVVEEVFLEDITRVPCWREDYDSVGLDLILENMPFNYHLVSGDSRKLEYYRVPSFAEYAEQTVTANGRRWQFRRRNKLQLYLTLPPFIACLGTCIKGRDPTRVAQLESPWQEAHTPVVG